MILKKSDMKAAVRLIRRGESFVIAVHVRPDPDAIGSALALARALRQLGKRAVVVSQDGVPETCSYLPDSGTVLISTGEPTFDVGVICDAGDLDRVGAARDALTSAKSLLVIDHHPTNGEQPALSGLPVVRLVEESCASSAEIVFLLLKELGVSVDSEIARQLMAGIVGDTGAFRFSNVTGFTLFIAAALAGSGASPAEAAREIYENRSTANTRLLGAALLAAQTEDDGTIVRSRITQDDFSRFQASDADTDSIVNQLTAIRGVKVAILFHELAENRVRVSLRSRDGIDVNQIARTFGGGGHAAAAGCTIESSLAEAEKAVIAEVRKWMASSI